MARFNPMASSCRKVMTRQNQSVWMWSCMAVVAPLGSANCGSSRALTKGMPSRVHPPTNRISNCIRWGVSKIVIAGRAKPMSSRRSRMSVIATTLIVSGLYCEGCRWGLQGPGIWASNTPIVLWHSAPTVAMSTRTNFPKPRFPTLSKWDRSPHTRNSACTCSIRSTTPPMRPSFRRSPAWVKRMFSSRHTC